MNGWKIKITNTIKHWLPPSQSIMDLASETGHYKVLEDRTNMAMHITKRWNGALDCTTSTIRVR